MLLWVFYPCDFSSDVLIVLCDVSAGVLVDVSFILLVLECFWEECICCDAHNSLYVFSLMYSRKDKQEMCVYIYIYIYI